jgi:UDP-glucose 4-epimerase
MSMKNVLITGGAGFIGFHLAKAVQQEGSHITIIDNFGRNPMDDEFRQLIANENVRFINADMTKKQFFGELDSRYDEIYHLAAINGTKYFYEKPYEVLRVNILSLMNLLEWINEDNTGKFLFTSSSEAYAGTITEFGGAINLIPTKEDVPLSINDVFNERFSYGGSKIAGELLTINYFRKLSIPFSIVRYHNIYGPRMGFEHVIPEFSKRIFDKKDPFELFGGDETRAFCYISDGVDGTIMAMRSREANNEVLHIGNDAEEVKITELARLMLELSDRDTSLKIEAAPEGCVKRRCPDISKMKKLTGFAPYVNLYTGVKKSLDWYLEKYKQLAEK